MLPFAPAVRKARKIGTFHPIKIVVYRSPWSQVDRRSRRLSILRRTERNPTRKNYNPRRSLVSRIFDIEIDCLERRGRVAYRRMSGYEIGSHAACKGYFLRETRSSNPSPSSEEMRTFGP